MSFLYSEQDVWGISNFDALLDAISNGRGIDSFLKDRRDLHKAALSVDKSYVQANKEIQEYTADIEKEKEILSELGTLESMLDEYVKEKKEVADAFQQIQHLYRDSRIGKYLQTFLDDYKYDYKYDGEFDRNALRKLQSNPDKVQRVFYGKKIKSFQSKLTSFVKKYQTKELYNLVKKYFPYNVSFGFENGKSNLQEQKSAKSRTIEQNKAALSRAISANKIREQEWEQKIEKEAGIIREFSVKLADDICNPKDLVVSEWVERLDGMDDEEMVMFDIATAAGYDYLDSYNVKAKAKVYNVMKYNCLQKGPETDKWFADKGCDTVHEAVELFSPVMRVRDAKKIIPKLCHDLLDAEVAANLVVAIRPNELLHHRPGYKDSEANSAMDVIMNAITNKEVSWYSTKTRHLGFEKYPDDEYLFSGSMISDDYKFLSRRQGRCGISFATQDFNYAFSYAALSSILANPSDKDEDVAHRESVTFDLYSERYRLLWNGKRVYVGFVNVYQTNPADRFYPNFGLERALANKDGIKHGFDNTRKIETFVTPEKNPVVDKLLCVVCNKKGYILPMQSQDYPDDVKKALQSLSAMYAGGMEDTLSGLKFSRRLSRFQKQKEEFESGVFHENDTLARQEERREKLINLTSKRVNDNVLTRNMDENII